jgi:outer membrane receptor protein involved in Fe transport
MRLSVAVAAVCLSVIGLAIADDVRASIRKPTNIPAESLSEALQTLAKNRNFQVVYVSEEVNKLRTQGAVGEFNTEEALRQLLKGTGMTYRYLDENTVTIVRVSASTSPLSSAGSPPAQPDSAPGASTPSDSQKEGKKDSSEQFRVAQVDQGANSRPSALASNSSISQESSKKGQIEEVIVTAQKRSENLMDVPASLTVLSAASLQTQGVTDFSDYMTLVPSLSDFSAGAEGHGAIILRGLNTGYYQFSNTVGYYIDDTPFSATSPLSYGTLLTMDPDLSDIDHLEVLKGPQATLYGASTLGGLIKVVTKQPNLNSDGAEVRVDGSTIDGGGSGYGVAGIANVVLIPGQMALRISGFDRDTPGYMTNLELDTKDRNVSRKEGGRISLLWVPTENLDIRVSAFLQSLFVDGWNYEFVNLQTLAPLTGPYTYSLHYDPTFHTTYAVYNATINYKVGSFGTLTNSTSYASYSDHEVVDYSLYYGLYYNPFAPAPVPVNAAQPLIYSPSLNKFTEELRFTSQRLGAFEFLTGLFYTNEQIGYTDDLFNTIPPSLEPIPGPAGNIFTFSGPADYKEEAAFADLTYYLADSLDLTVGGRYSHNRQDVTTFDTGFLLGTSVIPNSSSDSDFTYLGSLSWHLAQDIDTYARIASSYRPGGPQLTPLPGYPTSFKADSLINYEIGLKGDWLDHKLRTNIALYDMDWKDVQMSSSINGVLLISNGGKATVKGVELETQFLPIEHLSMGINLAYTDAKLDSVSASVSAITGAVAGDSLPFTPTWAASAVADYSVPLNGTLAATYGVTYRYQGSKWSDYPGDPLNTGVVIPHYDTLDIRAALNWSRYQLQARVANLFNEHGLDTVVDQRIAGNPPAWASIIPPRTFALSFTATF